MIPGRIVILGLTPPHEPLVHLTDSDPNYSRVPGERRCSPVIPPVATSCASRPNQVNDARVGYSRSASFHTFPSCSFCSATNALPKTHTFDLYQSNLEYLIFHSYTPSRR